MILILCLFLLFEASVARKSAYGKPEVAEPRVAAYGKPVTVEIEPVANVCELDVAEHCDRKCKVHCDNGVGNGPDCRPGRATFANDDPNGTAPGKTGAEQKIRYATSEKGDNTIVGGVNVAQNQEFKTVCYDKCEDEGLKACKANKKLEVVIEPECDRRIACRRERKTECGKKCKAHCDNGLGNGSDGCRPGRARFNNDDYVFATVGNGGAKAKIEYSNNVKGDTTTANGDVVAPTIIQLTKCDDDCDDDNDKTCDTLACEAPVEEEKKVVTKEEGVKVEEEKKDDKKEVQEEKKDDKKEVQEEKKDDKKEVQEEKKDDKKEVEEEKKDDKKEVQEEEKKDDKKETRAAADGTSAAATTTSVAAAIPSTAAATEAATTTTEAPTEAPVKFEEGTCLEIPETDFPNIIYIVEEDEKCADGLKVDIDILNLQVAKLTLLLNGNGVKVDEFCSPNYPPEITTTTGTGSSSTVGTTDSSSGGTTDSTTPVTDTSIGTSTSVNGTTTTGTETTSTSGTGTGDTTTTTSTPGTGTGDTTSTTTTKEGETTTTKPGETTTTGTKHRSPRTSVTGGQSATKSVGASSSGAGNALLIAGVVIGSAVCAGIAAVALGFIVSGAAAGGAAPASAAPMAACATNPLYTPMTSGGANPNFQ